jgi:hypothetical protein
MTLENAQKIKALLPNWEIKNREGSAIHYHLVYKWLIIDDNSGSFFEFYYPFEISGFPDRKKVFKLDEAVEAVKEYMLIPRNMIAWCTHFLTEHEGAV